jgi:hypothetical protein
MTVFGLWQVNLNLPPPPTPQDAVKMNEGFAALIKSQLQAGVIKEVYAFLEGNEGYFITGDVPDEALYEALSMWTPFVTFRLHRTVPFPKAIDLVVSASKKLAQKR